MGYHPQKGAWFDDYNMLQVLVEWQIFRTGYPIGKPSVSRFEKHRVRRLTSSVVLLACIYRQQYITQYSARRFVGLHSVTKRPVALMSEIQPPIIAPQDDGSGIIPEHEAPEPAPITEEEVGDYREQDRFLPVRHLDNGHYVPYSHCRSHSQIANVSRIMKSSVPSTAKIAKDAKECVQECVSEFISFITSEAAEKCQLEKRKTIGGEDILYAMVNLGFENYAETLKIHLAKLRQVCGKFFFFCGILVC